MLTIIGGNWRGRKLKVPRSDSVRPSSAKVRGSIFNILESLRLKQGLSKDFSGSTCLDLFAGSGALGFEAMSRGAERAVFVEKSRENAKIIEQNAAELGCSDRIVVYCMPADAAIEKIKGKGDFHLVLADPPYDYAHLQKLVQGIALPGMLVNAGIFVLEHAPKSKVEPEIGLKLHSERLLGPASISVFTRE